MFGIPTSIHKIYIGLIITLHAWIWKLEGKNDNACYYYNLLANLELENRSLEYFTCTIHVLKYAVYLLLATECENSYFKFGFVKDGSP